jgi:hypothetical protein
MDNLLHSVFGAMVLLAYFVFMTQMVLPSVFGKWLKRAPNQSKTSLFIFLFILIFILGGYFIGLYFFPSVFNCSFSFLQNHPKLR